MRIVIIGNVNKYLPHYGIAWVRGGCVKETCEDDEVTQSNSIAACEILDDRRGSLLSNWAKEYLSEDAAQVTLVTHSVTLRDETAAILRGVSVSVDIEFLKDVSDIIKQAEAGVTRPIEISYKLLPSLAMQARHVLRQSYVSRPHVWWVSRIGGKTTLTRYNAFMLGVLNSPNMSHMGVSTPRVSLQSFFDRCSTPMGKRRVEPLLLHPSLDPGLIAYRASLIKYLTLHRPLRVKVQSACLSRFMDIDKLTFLLSVSNKQDDTAKRKTVTSNFSHIITTISSALLCVSLLTGCVDLVCEVSEVETRLLKLLRGNLACLKKLDSLIHHVFSVDKLEAALSDPSVILLNPDLVDVAASSSELIAKVNEAMENARADAEYDLCGSTNGGKVKLTTMPSGQKVLRVAKSVDVTQKYILLRVNKAEIQFTTQQLQDLNDRLASAGDMVKSCERAFIAKTLEVTKTYAEPLKEFADLWGELDICCSIAAAINVIDQSNTWCVPEVVVDTPSTPLIYIEEGRHPLLEIQEGLKGKVSSVIPNSAVLNKQRKSLLVTGPNMGGKSTYARQVALHCLLAQLGVLCPSKSTRITPLELIWTRVGAHDSPAGGASTFMTEASETAGMLAAIKASEGGCLAVLDELGRGTSASDGLAFAAAVLQELLQMGKCLSVFATHFHELASAPLPGVCAMRMASEETKSRLPSFAYKVKDGVENDSDGILLAKNFGFPTEIIEEALSMVN
eukprot:Blabericola_migrator_1__2446@NODE_168_length_12126_cov_91_620864_g146_i0_p3_GENE_NODE_168_length_12126_cov_91_620864_g146_i0NODE_168_length_12126_cov_91_620864_g146_i0_p3_ORF_typecomplete_len732_score150_66MutS_V/PF00488_21/1_4e03MutS_V/PF00488_21/5_6e03MutS_V/PF00488_21/2_1e52MutS_III/PF05192_18/3_4e23MutS_IV/PF05190_18/1_1e03MutS_IV/PF05190_18/0_0016NTPase_1/PF03266_15/0_01AAA_22/PF13401_6/0_46TniB/PF05621_11/0_36_NODE_168_length_12126_cov_91_620864_g146_i047296924